MNVIPHAAPTTAAILLSLVIAVMAGRGVAGAATLEGDGDKTASSAEQEPVRAPQRIRLRQRRIVMGVPFHITVYAAELATAIEAMDEAFARIEELDDVFSDYDPDSEARRLTEEITPGRPVPISDDMRDLLRLSLCLSRQSEGAFDVTISPVVKLWRRARRTGEKPSPKALEQALSRVGWQYLSLGLEESTLAFAKKGMALDFGGIAKGYACDEALEVLASYGITRALVDAGGDMACGQAPPGQPGWLIAVEPRVKKGSAQRRLIVVENQGVATSGDTYQFVEFDGVRYSHIVDPKTGMGLTTPSSVTMIAPTGARADALASAVSVMGPKDGLALVEETDGAEAIVVWLDESGEPHRARSDGFADYFWDQ